MHVFPESYLIVALFFFKVILVNLIFAFRKTSIEMENFFGMYCYLIFRRFSLLYLDQLKDFQGLFKRSLQVHKMVSITNYFFLNIFGDGIYCHNKRFLFFSFKYLCFFYLERMRMKTNRIQNVDKSLSFYHLTSVQKFTGKRKLFINLFCISFQTNI